MARIVVGVDGSERSLKALVRGAHEARLRDADLEAVFIYPPPHRDFAEELGDLPHGIEAGPRPRGETEEAASERTRRARQRAHNGLATAVKEVFGDADEPKPRLVVIPADEPADALVKHAEGADMLVIGLRRRSPVGKLVLGSDARDIILQARTPVLTVYNEPGTEE